MPCTLYPELWERKRETRCNRGPHSTLAHGVLSRQALPYVCLLIAMLFFIYAIIGMQVSARTLPRSGVEQGKPM